METRKGISYISSPLISADAAVHAFLGRKGGVSSPPFDSLNFDGRSGDPTENLTRNRELLEDAFGIPVERLVTVNQVHGSSVVTVKKGFERKVPVDADAIVTAETEVPIGIMTADCLPILLHDPKRKAIAAVHAGWKGTVKGVVLKAIEAMRREYATDPASLRAALGPSIGPCCYPVGEVVLDEFRASFKDLSYFRMIDGALRLDIGLANLSQLISIGVRKENISALTECTSCLNNLFFSYRKESGRTGRQLSFIMLRHNAKGVTPW